MTYPRDNRKLGANDLEKIRKKYDVDSLQLSTAYSDGGIDPLWARFARAVANQIDSGDATLSRYAIWANTVRDNIAKAIELMEAGETEEAKRLMTRAANSLSAFSDVQASFDPFDMGESQ